MAAEAEAGLVQLTYSFSIAGAQKSGTSSLSELLDQHPRIRPAPRKEVHYFDDETRDWAHDDHASYHVDGRPDQLVGDATPVYLWWPQAMQRMRAYNPDMRVIGIFRDPIERLFSHWVMVQARWPKVAHDWPRFLTKFAPDGLEDTIPDGAHIGGFRMHSGVVRGYYGAQLEQAISLFGADHVHTLEFRAFLRDHGAALDSITDFLGLPRFEVHPELPHSMRGKDRIVGTPPTGADIEALVERYRDDFATFKKLTGLDCSEWPLQRLLDGDLAPDELAAQYAAKVVPGQVMRQHP
jgi:hypothetical protein